VTNIHEKAFKGTKNLQIIHMLSMKPSMINVDETAFDDVFDNCLLQIPNGTEEAYRSHPVFGKFKYIIENDTKT